MNVPKFPNQAVSNWLKRQAQRITERQFQPLTDVLLSVHQSVLFSTDKHSSEYLCHVHYFVHNFTDTPVQVNNTYLYMDGLLLEPRNPEHLSALKLTAQPQRLPFAVNAKGFVEGHSYFSMRPVLSSNSGRFSVTMSHKTIDQDIKFKIASF
ncbi:hypothetical protein LLE49_20990 [Alicyclobacillus tolerans]|uniref:hypothetical protein n=1 Tax=Alicyclobacillus tolerans TaxID=90970 RepID=UPI001F3B6233|nr:hypothetical protein [Alicyclobacillus tolerans]MCF8567200.1 hypothetical protein [Alicyclobacillus tolerans]